MKHDFIAYFFFLGKNMALYHSPNSLARLARGHLGDAPCIVEIPESDVYPIHGVSACALYDALPSFI